MLLELGGTQAGLILRPLIDERGYDGIETWCDEDGDLRGVEARLGA